MWAALLLMGCPPERDGPDRAEPPPTPPPHSSPGSSGSTAETGPSPVAYPRCGSLDRSVRWSGSGVITYLAPGPEGTLFAAGNLGSDLVLGEEGGAPRLFGSCAGFADAMLVRLDAGGRVLWSRVARGCGVGSNALDAADGRVAWLTARSATIAVFPGGGNPDVEVTEHGMGDEAVAVYTDQGDLLWVGDIGGPTSDHSLDVALAPDRSVVVVGYFNAVGPITVAPGPGEVVLEPSEKWDTGFLQDDGYLARWNPDGTLAWAQVIGGAGDITPSTVAVLDDGTIVVVGAFTRSLLLAPGTPEQVQHRALDSGDGTDGFVAAWDSSGRLKWSQVWGDGRVGNSVDGTVPFASGVLSILVVGRNAVFGSPSVPWDVDDMSYAMAQWTAGGEVTSARSVLSALGGGLFSLDALPSGWTAASGTADRLVFGASPNTTTLTNVVGGGDPLLVTWRPDGTEACAWPMLSTREDFYETAWGAMLDGRGGVWAAVNFNAQLDVVPGTPEALTLTDTTTYGADVLLARFLLEAPDSTASAP